MKLIKWSFRGLVIPMIKADPGDMYCTSAALCAALGLKAGGLRKLLHDNPKLAPVSVTSGNAKGLETFLREHREELGVKRVRADLLLWPFREALRVAYLARTDVSWEFIDASVDLVAANAAEDAVSREEWDALVRENEEQAKKLEETNTKLNELERFVKLALPGMNTGASAFGRGLSAQKLTKKVRQFYAN